MNETDRERERRGRGRDGRDRQRLPAKQTVRKKKTQTHRQTHGAKSYTHIRMIISGAVQNGT